VSAGAFMAAVLAGPQGMLKGETPDYAGPDGVNRKIVDDRRATVTTTKPGTYKLSEFLSHPTLFQRYPELGEVKVNVFQTSPSEEYNRFKAFFNHRENSLNIIVDNFPVRDRERHIVADTLHEVQHKIQEKEGMAIGGTPRDMGEARKAWEQETQNQSLTPEERSLAQMGLKSKNDMVARYADEFAKYQYGKSLDSFPPEEQQRIRDLVAYFLLYGEQEASAVGEAYRRRQADPRPYFSYPESLVRQGGERFSTPEAKDPITGQVRDFIQQMNQRLVKPQQVSELNLFDDTTASTIG